MIDDAPSALTTLVSAWKAYKPSFLWVPTAGKLLTDQVRGVRGRIVGKALLAPGGIINPVANSATGYLSFPTNANTTGAGRAFLGAMIVYVKDPASVTGSFVKVGGDSDGVGFGAGNSTFEDSGTKAMGLVEAIAWQPGTANFFCRGVNVIVFGYDTSKVVRMYNQTTGIDSSVAGGYTVISPSNIIRINGYLTNRTSNVQVCAVAVFGNVAPTTAYIDQFIRATRPAGRAIGRMGRGGLDSLFRARYYGLPENLSAGGGGATISATPGNAVADGTTASVKRTIPATPGNASADGTTASVVRVIGAAPGNAAADGATAAVTRTIAATPGNAAADGVTATVTNSGTTTISCTPGNAVADGSLAAITRTITAAPGNAVANGAIAALLRVIATTPGDAVADGVTAAVHGSITISCTPGNAVADGVAATVTNGDAQGAGMGFSMSRMRRLVKIQFNGKLYQAFEEDIPELLETLEEQAEQKIKKKRNARAKPAPVAVVVSAPADVLPSLQSRIAEVNHSIGVLWGADEDEDEEILWLML